MTTTPGNQPDQQGGADEEGDDSTSTPEGAGAEIGIAEGEGSTFEPEEDAEGADGQ